MCDVKEITRMVEKLDEKDKEATMSFVSYLCNRSEADRMEEVFKEMHNLVKDEPAWASEEEMQEELLQERRKYRAYLHKTARANSATAAL